jgi:alkylated DNA repair protein alkB family protein 6
MALARDEHRVSPLSRVWLVPDYVDAEEEAALIAAASGPAARWTQVSGRRLQALGGTVHEAAGLLPAPLPKWVKPLLARLQAQAGLFDGAELNHVLVNCYAAGEGIMPHQDGPLYHPAVAILSLGADTVLTFTPHPRLHDPTPEAVSVWLPRRSLLLFADEAYTAYLHGIAAREVDDLRCVSNAPSGAGEVRREGTRISLTCRSVLKVRRNLLPTRP